MKINSLNAISPIDGRYRKKTESLSKYFSEKSGKVYNFAHKNFYVITRYNRSRLYALAVYFLGEEIKNAKTKMERR